MLGGRFTNGSDSQRSIARSVIASSLGLPTNCQKTTESGDAAGSQYALPISDSLQTKLGRREIFAWRQLPVGQRE
jgi:hypothetical protein